MGGGVLTEACDKGGWALGKDCMSGVGIAVQRN